MLFLLRYLSAFVGAGIALIVAVVAHSVAQAATARALGDRLPASTGRLNPDPRRHLDPFAVIVMLIAAIGWNKAVPLQEPRFRGGRGRYVLAVLSGPFANLVLATLGLVALAAVADPRILPTADPIGVVHLDSGYGFAEMLLFEFTVVNAAVGVLTLLPIPPLDGARLLWLYAPKTPGWQNARYQLEERNFGLGIVVLLSLPLIGGGLLRLIVVAVSGAFLAPLAMLFGLDIKF